MINVIMMSPSKFVTIKLINLIRWWTERYRASSATSSGLRTSSFPADVVLCFRVFFSRTSKSPGSGLFGPSCWRLVKNSGRFATVNLNETFSSKIRLLSNSFDNSSQPFFKMLYCHKFNLKMDYSKFWK